jgi:hypothetical protein
MTEETMTGSMSITGKTMIKSIMGKRNTYHQAKPRKFTEALQQDYAPGQVKKKNHGEKNHHHKKNEHHKHD